MIRFVKPPVTYRVTPKMGIECGYAQIRNARVVRLDKDRPSIHAELFFGVIEDGVFHIPAGMEARCLALALHDYPERKGDPAGADYEACDHVALILKRTESLPPGYKSLGIAVEEHLVEKADCRQCRSAGYKLEGEVVLP